jgi:hypothetical protein
VVVVEVVVLLYYYLMAVCYLLLGAVEEVVVQDCTAVAKLPRVQLDKRYRVQQVKTHLGEPAMVAVVVEVAAGC